MSRATLDVGSINQSGYAMLGREFRHVLVAEAALGKSLPEGVEVHHWDKDRANYNNSNLVICPDAAYHALLHIRATAYDACGHASWRKCAHCKQWDDLINLSDGGRHYYHKVCKAKYAKELYHRKLAPVGAQLAAEK